ncbi:MAG: hydroxyacylglutathione hydrolase [Halioglobus sp.]|jgi:hydroxyacylglutathione hydrolase
MSIQCTIVPVTPYQQNCSIIKCEATAKAAIVDPGGDIDRILGAVEKMGATVEKIILTHAHMDHCAASDVLRQQLEIPIEGPHKEDQFWLDGLPQACEMVGFPPAAAFLPDRWLDQGDTVMVGEQQLQVFHCPGHTPGHVVFLYEPQQIAWVGDVLFQGSIGRTDFPRGNHEELIDSIRNKLFPLGDEITFIPGHGPTSTFGQERQTNPFVADERYG